MNKVPSNYAANSSVAIWLEARRRCRNHLRLALVEKGVKSNQAAKMDLEAKVDELMSSDDGEYIRVAFVKLKIGAEDD